jgi:hypothetical protein
MNHASKKSKRESWRQVTICDGEGQWMFNPMNQAIHEESHITKCQFLLNQDMKELGDQK